MPIDTNPEWLRLMLYAAGAAFVLILIFNLPYIGRILRALFSFALLAFCLMLLLQQAPFDPNLARLTDRLGLDRQEVRGEEVRIAMSRDGHFWARATINGTPRRMLVDSGATVTAISTETAALARIADDDNLLPITLRTANGAVQARSASIARLELGPIAASNLKVVVSPALGNIDVLGMNFLSRLAAWRVEGRTLILTPRQGTEPQ